MPKLIKHHREFDGDRAAESAEVFARILAAADEYFNERWVAWGGKAPSRRHKWWHDDAFYLHWILDSAAVQARSPLSFTHVTAPAVVFIDEALSRAKVEHEGPDAIAQCLARYRAKTERQLKSMLEKRSAISAT